MIDADISDAGISMMCDIARTSLPDLDADKRVLLDGLIAEGLVDVGDPAAPANSRKWVLTPKGQRLLDNRGVGVNES